MCVFADKTRHRCCEPVPHLVLPVKTQASLGSFLLQLLQQHCQSSGELLISGGIQQRLHAQQQEHCAENTISKWKINSESLILVL